jgi:hypothetical protein
MLLQLLILISCILTGILQEFNSTDPYIVSFIAAITIVTMIMSNINQIQNVPQTPRMTIEKIYNEDLAKWNSNDPTKILSIQEYNVSSGVMISILITQYPDIFIKYWENISVWRDMNSKNQMDIIRLTLATTHPTLEKLAIADVVIDHGLDDFVAEWALIQCGNRALLVDEYMRIAKKLVASGVHLEPRIRNNYKPMYAELLDMLIPRRISAIAVFNRHKVAPNIKKLILSYTNLAHRKFLQ